jgi:hypothetical protein
VDVFLVIAAICTMINCALRINMSVLESPSGHPSLDALTPEADRPSADSSPSVSTASYMLSLPADCGYQQASSSFSNTSAMLSTLSFVVSLHPSLSLSGSPKRPHSLISSYLAWLLALSPSAARTRPYRSCRLKQCLRADGCHNESLSTALLLETSYPRRW